MKEKNVKEKDDVEESKKDELFSTRDLNLASTLVTLKFFMVNVDFQIEGIKRLPVGYFSFEETEKLQETIRLYWQGKLMVEPMAFVTTLRGLKAQVSNVYNSPRVDMSQFKEKS